MDIEEDDRPDEEIPDEEPEYLVSLIFSEY